MAHAYQLLLLVSKRSASLGFTEPQGDTVVKWLKSAEMRLGVREKRAVCGPGRQGERNIMEQSSEEEEEEEEMEGKEECGGMPLGLEGVLEVYACDQCGAEFFDLEVILA